MFRTVYNYGPAPYDNAQLNLWSGYYTPSTVKPRNNAAFLFWQRSLYQRMVTAIDFTLPEDWEGSTRDFFNYCIFRNGFVCVMDPDEFGISFQPAGLSGHNFYYQPTRCIIANPLYDAELEIGKDCEILKLSPDYRGYMDIVDYYAEKLALLDNSINTSLVNLKLSWIIGAKTKAAADALKKILDKVDRGDPAVVYDMRIANDPKDSDTPFQFLERKTGAKENYITHDQLQDVATLLNAFDAEIGIPSAPYQKKERMVTSEAESRRDDAMARVTGWVDCFNSSAKRVNALFGTNISASVHYEEGGTEDGTDTGDDKSLYA